MKYLVYTVLVLAFLIPCSDSYAQRKKKRDRDQENVGEDYSTLSRTKSILQNATGWAKQDNGKWTDAKNLIPYSDWKTRKNPSQLYKLGLENFNFLEMRSVIIDNKQYSVLGIEFNDGEYEFPILEEGWKSYKSLEYYVFEAEALSHILEKDVEFNKPYTVNLEVFTSGLVRDYTPGLIDEKIGNRIESTRLSKHFNAANIVFAVYPIQKDGKESVRFKVIRGFSKPSLVGFYLDPRNAEALFSLNYYEAQYHKFKKFIRDAEAQIIPTEDNPTDFQAYYNWGVLKYQTGDFEGAIDYFNQAVELNPDNEESMLYSYRGIAKNKLGDYNGAIEDFDRAIDIKPSKVMDYSNWVKNYFNRGVAKFYINDLNGACNDWEKSYELGYGPSLDYINEYCK